MNKNDNRKILRRLLAYAKPYGRYMVFALFSAFIGVSLSLFIPILIGDAVDYIIGPGNVDFEGAGRILLYLGGAIGGSTVFQWLMAYSSNKLAILTVKDLRTHAFSKLNRVPLKYIDRTAHGNLTNTMVNDIDAISDGLLQGFAQLFTGIITIMGTLIFMISIHVWIGLAVIFLTPISLFVASYIAKSTYSKFTEQSAIKGEMGGLIEEMLGNQKIVKTFSYEKRAEERFQEVNERLHKCGVSAQFYSSLTNPSTRFMNGMIYAAVGVMGAFAAINMRMTIGQVSSFLAYANQYTKPFNEISGVITEFQSALASAKRVFTLIDEQQESDDTQLKDEIICDGRVNMEQVSFAYQKENPLIEDLNLKVFPGSRVAIVGPTGSGKTTMINLLMRFYDVDSGIIKVSGQDIMGMKRGALRRLFGMVLQETWLIHGTVRENIAYGVEEVSEEEIIQAAKSAHAHSFIMKLPLGYDTVISEDGGNLSQGQKQLLCIARVFLVKPPMLILDEATSNIDTLTEVKIQESFARLMEERTSFVVAHRLSTIKEADIILVMNNGHIIEQGSHEQLLAHKGFYANLYESQFAVGNTI